MSAAEVLVANAEAAVQAGVIALLREDPGVRSFFGTPARIYDDETQAPAFPFAVLERHETRPAGASCVPGTEHTITIGVRSRFEGRYAAMAAIGAIRAALEHGTVEAEGQHVVLVLPAYADVVRTSDGRAFRGVLRLRIITEQIEV